ncbi:MAG: cyoD [Candidatus Saccharibacteria bacterium]|nr:cyoD [Candidatus Saccharibacteria bacterium]MDB5181116.1 cyoD [Candidatus Saccharibacteria bacterium]
MSPKLDHRHSPAKYISYVVGFVLSLATTLLAYFFVVNELWPKESLIYTVMGIAVVQLVIQLVFFLHLGRGNRWKVLTFLFAVLVVLVVVVGSLWIMQNLDYNMMHMSPDQMTQYMSENEGI